mgnify:CR=1 FL=1
MPAEQCNNGKWKWGQTGECKYDSKEEAEKDNENYYRDLSDIDLTPTKGMVEEAKKGKEWRKEFGRGGTEVGLKSANMIINNELTIERVKKMYAYFQRHEVDKQAEGFEVGEDGFPSAGRIAWALWGGDAGMSWSTKKRNQIEKEEKEERVTEKIEKALEKKVEEHNEEVKDLSLDWNGKVTFKTLETVFDRGVGAYNTNPSSVRPSVSSPEQWALARVNSFLYALKKGKFRSGKHDTDLLPAKHPVVLAMKEDKNIENIWDKKFDNIMEKRVYNIETRVEKDENDKEVVVGYGSIFNSRSENLGGFYEYIAPEAITNETIMASDVRALINHDPNLILARSKNGEGNLMLSVDEKGLRYQFNIPETSYGKDLAINLKNGNISQSSFAFTIAEGGDTWSTDDEGRDIRTITKINRLYDISSVTYPAYSEASSDLVIAQRGLQTYKESQKKQEEENDLVKRSLAKLKIELIKRKK